MIAKKFIIYKNKNIVLTRIIKKQFDYKHYPGCSYCDIEEGKCLYSNQYCRLCYYFGKGCQYDKYYYVFKNKKDRKD